MIDKQASRLFNLKMRLFKYLIDKQLNINNQFTIEDLKNEENLYFREIDFLYLDKSDWIISSTTSYKLSENLHGEFNQIKERYTDKKEYNSLYNKLKKAYSEIEKCNKEKNSKNIHIIALSQKEIAYKLYAMTLVEFPEYLIENMSNFPTSEDFFDHIHVIEDIYQLLSNPKPYSKFGDVNLNQKMRFVIFTNRWGHDDFYDIARSIDGWVFYGLHHHDGSTNCEKDGSGALIGALEHDNINFPHKLKSVFKYLWEEADKTEMSIDEMSGYIDNIADWVSLTEKAKPKFLSEMGIM